MPLEKIIVINLDKDHDRLYWMEEQFKGRSFQRFSAYSPKTLPEELKRRYLKPAQNPCLLATEQACFASHLSVCMELAQSNSQDDSFWMICEDDIKINPKGIEDIKQLPWNLAGDICRLNEYPKAPSRRLTSFGEGSQLIEYGRIPNGAAAYLINPVGARKLIQHAWCIDMPWDIFLRSTWLHQLTTTGVFPPIIRPDQFEESSIAPPQERSGRKRSYSINGFVATGSFAKRMASSLERFKNFRGLYLPRLLQMKLQNVRRDYEGKFIL